MFLRLQKHVVNPGHVSGPDTLERGIKMEKQKKKVYQILMVVFSVGFLFCMGLVIRDYLVKKEAQKQYEELAQNVLPVESETEIEVVETETETKIPDPLAERGIDIPKLDLDWNALAEENEDIYAWIYIPETKVNYPVLQHETETDYYLDHNLDHSKGLPGSIYTQNINAKDFSDRNTILYGHNMKDGSMFKTLHYFEDGEFFAENRYIYVYTPEKVLVYEIYAACEFTNAHLLYKYDFTKAEAIASFMEDLKEARAMNNQIQEEMEVPEDGRLITLSTCIGGKPNNRWLVVGTLLGETNIKDFD